MILGYDLKLLSFEKKKKHWIYMQLTHFQRFIFIQKSYTKKCHMLGQL
jgi:hypothetical protein